ncbi:hypothetical protein Y1Q_0010717 [Alligator mississippiensis]|uniref:Uncharacterized protein n=1 Tax=Alligator mississippiensis TaxID=8496 RepID=A0A151M6S2_ALLMI|nr:hypothetical protein Y1Q_0010717 [Alligator mississippiensis]
MIKGTLHTNSQQLSEPQLVLLSVLKSAVAGCAFLTSFIECPINWSQQELIKHVAHGSGDSSTAASHSQWECQKEAGISLHVLGFMEQILQALGYGSSAE